MNPKRERRALRLRPATFAPILVGCGLLSQAASAASPPLVELKVEGKTYRGRVAALDSSSCWLMGRDGRLDRLEVKRIEAHQQASATFRGLSGVEMRDELRREFGGGFDVAATDHYVVCGPKGHTDGLAPIFEDVYRAAQRYFSVRGFTFKKPEFPLVAVIYPNRARFAERCRVDQVTEMAGLMGYYLPSSNRVSLFDPGETATSALDPDEGSELPAPFAPPSGTSLPWNREPKAFAKVGGMLSARSTLRDTIIHETTHQVAYNTGLHARLGETPRWVVEGFATMFEAPGVRDGSKNGGTAQRINRERYLRFGNYAKSRRASKSLKDFLAGDDMLPQSTLDFYGQAWALTFYLVETRPSEYARYLKKMADRDPLKGYSAEDRVNDFTAAFGGGIDGIEVDFLRYMERLNVE